MTDTVPTLHLFCGKIAAGKSTLATRIAQAEDAILISEDTWLSALFADQMATGADFMRFSAKLRDAMGPHVRALLASGLSVALDFQANTVESRDWMRSLLDGTRADHRLHVLMPPDDICLERMHARNAGSGHPFAVTEAQFQQFSKYFVPPKADEGFTLVMYDQAE